MYASVLSEKRRLAEEEAKRLEEEARIAWEVEQARLKVEAERISCEREGLHSFYEWRSKALADFGATAASMDEVSIINKFGYVVR
jgi:hypothetical protein